MLKVVAKAVVKEEKLEEYKKLAAELAAETRKENGCIAYELFEDADNGKILTFIEEWESRAALDSHMKTGHFTEIVPKLGKLQESGSELNIYTLVL